jgi:hypothetical protein
MLRLGTQTANACSKMVRTRSLLSRERARLGSCIEVTPKMVGFAT